MRTIYLPPTVATISFIAIKERQDDEFRRNRADTPAISLNFHTIMEEPMARKKVTAENQESLEDSALVQHAQEVLGATPVEPGADLSHLEPATPGTGSDSTGADVAPAAARRSWLAKFPISIDAEAGVRLIEDRKNRQMTIKFDEKPSEPVRKLMKEEYGYRFDPEDQLWYKRINPAKARQTREEAEELAFKASNLIREEKGLEQKSAFALSM